MEIEKAWSEKLEKNQGREKPWSVVSDGAKRSSKKRTSQYPLDLATRRSLMSLVRAVSLGQQGLKAEWSEQLGR